MHEQTILYTSGLDMAMVRGNTKQVKNILKNNRDLVEYKDNKGNNLLHFAVETYKKPEIFDALLDAGVDAAAINKAKYTPIEYAASIPNWTIIIHYLEKH